MQKVDILDKQFELFISHKEIDESIKKVANQINRDFKNESVLILAILNGSFVFAADLIRKLNIPVEISFIKLASYDGTQSTGTVNQLIGLNENLENRNLILVEDIVDTGRTLKSIFSILHEKQPKTVKLASLLFKPDAFTQDYPVDYVGKEIPNDFIVGYGLDYNGYGRNLKNIYKIIE